MQSVDVLFPYVQPEVTACPNEIVRMALMRAAIEFCEKTGVYRTLEDTIPIVDGVASWEVDTPFSDYRLVQILNVYGAWGELTPKSMGQIAILLPNWKTAIGQPFYYNQSSATEIQVFPKPANTPAGTFISIRASFAPLPSSRRLDDDLVNLYFEGIVARAKAILMQMGKQPWSDTALAGINQAVFLERCDEAKIDMLHDRTKGSIEVTPRRFGG